MAGLLSCFLLLWGRKSPSFREWHMTTRFSSPSWARRCARCRNLGSRGPRARAVRHLRSDCGNGRWLESVLGVAVLWPPRSVVRPCRAWGKGGSRRARSRGGGLRERWADAGTSVPVGEGHSPLSPGGLTWPARATCPSDATLFRLFPDPTVCRTVSHSWEFLFLSEIRFPLDSRRAPASRATARAQVPERALCAVTRLLRLLRNCDPSGFGRCRARGAVTPTPGPCSRPRLWGDRDGGPGGGGLEGEQERP